MEYKKEEYHSQITVKEYMENYVDIPTFLECCKACPYYGQKWSCPPYDFQVEAYWKKYQYLDIIGLKLSFSEEMTNRTYTKQELDDILKEVLEKERLELTKRLWQLEKEYAGSISLSAGSCLLCENCERPKGKACRMPDKMRYSIESLGGNVGLTTSTMLGVELEWMTEGKLPHYFTLISGLLSNCDSIVINKE